MLLTTFNPSVNIFGIDIYYYAIIIICGMILAVLVMYLLFKKQGMDPNGILDYAVWIIPFAILGARFFFFLFPYEGTTSDWSQFFHFRQGGLAIYGGVIVGALVVLIVSKIKKQNFFQVGDTIIPGLMLAQAIGRWGNFVNQEAFGEVITNPALQWFPIGVNIGGVWHQATFFYESAWNLIGFAIVMLLISKRYRKGLAVMFYCLYYGLGRLWIEGLRTDSLHLIIAGWDTGIRISQLISVILMILGAIGLCVIYRKEIRGLFGGRKKARKSGAAQSEPPTDETNEKDK